MCEYGLDANRWFCVLDYLEPGYLHRPSREHRDLDPKPFMALVEYIVETLGGQLARVGHPQMTPFPKRRGFVDLAMLEDRFMLHAFAVSRVRFMVGPLTGISHLGSAMDTPTTITYCTDSLYFLGVWRDQDVVLYQNLYEAGVRWVSTMALHESGLLHRKNHRSNSQFWIPPAGKYTG